MLRVRDLPSGLFRDASVAIGSYDGLHLGHRAILCPMIARAHAESRPAVLVTFDPIPPVYFAKLPPNSNITLADERADLAEQLGMDAVITLPFGAEVARMAGASFLRGLSGATRMKELWMGSDFRLGSDRLGRDKGLADVLAGMECDLVVTERIQSGEEELSSSRIRTLLSEGELDHANELLSYPFFIRNVIQHGAQIGTRIGIPTLNISFPECKIRLPFGVYVTRTLLDGMQFESITSIGVRPTFYEKSEVVIESYLFDVAVDAYEKQVEIDFFHMLRPEKKFANSDELVVQIDADIALARAYLAKLPKELAEMPCANALPYHCK